MKEYKIYLITTAILFWVVNLTSRAPDTLWTKTYGGEGSDRAYSVEQTTDGGFIIAGYINSFGAGNFDVYLIKTDGEGDTHWTKTYGGIEDDKGFAVQQINDSGYIVTGCTRSFGTVSSDVYLIRTDAQGESLWTKTYGGDTTDIGYSVYETSDGGYIIAGETVSFGAGRSDFYLIKTEPDPSFVQEQKYHSLEKNKKELAYHPNPFTSVVNIKCFGIDDKRKVRLGIYDSSGRLIKTILLSTDHLSLGSDLPPGIYFLKLNGKLAGKVVKVR